MSKISRKHDLKIIGITIGLLALHFVLYFSSKPFVHDPIILNNDLEDQIPLVPFFIIFYISWYFLLLIVPFIIGRKNMTYFKIYCIGLLLWQPISILTFIFWPNAVKVPVIETNDFFTFLCNLIYSNDVPATGESSNYLIINNCFPSGHTFFSMMFIYCTLFCKQLSKPTKIVITVLSIMIIISTIMVKQHVIFDLVGGILIATVVFFVVRYFVLKRQSKE